MTIQQVASDLLASNMFLLKECGHCIIVDPCENASNYDPSLTYDFIFLTHEHYDHISGVDKWRERTGAQVICSRACGENIQDAKKNMSHYFGSFCQMQAWETYDGKTETADYVCCADKVFENDISFTWQGHDVRLFSAPGHSAGSSCMFINENILFAGDCLIPGFPTETRFPGGSKKRWQEETLPKLQELPEQTILYPGHLMPCRLFDVLRSYHR